MAKTKRVQIGTVGVDAGLCYLGDPCYVIGKELGRMEWGEFLDKMYESDPVNRDNAMHWTVSAPFPNPAAGEFRAGIVVSTGYGDGEYPVFAEINDEGRVMSVTVRFGQ